MFVVAVSLSTIVACDDSSGRESATTTPATIAVDTGVTSDVTVVLDGGAERSVDGTVSVEVSTTSATAGFEVQVSSDPTFAGATWMPSGAPVELALDGGYQVVFARIRSTPDGIPSRPGVAGITVDRWFDAATSSADGGAHRASWAGLVAPNVVQIRIETGRVVLNGSAPDDLVIGRPIDTATLDEPATYGWESTSPAIVSVSRISRPIGTIVSGQADGPMIHDISLTLEAPLELGVPHTLVAPGADVEPTTFTIDPTTTRSPAVHVNQVGFAPTDTPKLGFVSSWTGTAGSIPLPDDLPFEIISVSDGSSVLSGTTRRRATSGTTGEFGLTADVTAADVAEADFSELDAPGRYRLCVPSLGCSFDFVISDHSWSRVATAVARSAYHQRNGIALGPPFTPINRPRPFHPEDGVLARTIPLRMTDRADTIGRDDRFEEYEANDGAATVDSAWGGHFDAGDWNSRVDHLSYLKYALDLVELYPEVWADADLNIPESGDAIPDLIDEGLWDLDLYRRLQDDAGGVPGAVDHSRFGEGEETSWANDVDVVVYTPDAWSTYVYVAAAARAAHVLEQFDATRAAEYRESATRAMAWAEAVSLDSFEPDVVAAVAARRAVAAAAMLQLTGDPAWDEVFRAASELDDRTLEPMDCEGAVCEAAWLYGRLAPDLADATTQRNAVGSFVATADAIVTAQASTGFGWVMERTNMPMVWGLGPSMAHGIGLLRAYVLTGDPAYRSAMVGGASYSLGGNPLDTVFATGLGTVPARFPLVVDARHAGIEVSPGLFQYGAHDLSYDGGDDWVEEFFLDPTGTTPSAADVPLLWSWYDVGLFPQMNEFTYQQGHGNAIWTFGVLAAT